MKRYVCTVAAGLLLALTSTATASADTGLPVLGQSGSQESSLGSQAVGEQKNDADVTQQQGNGNVSISPAIAIFGDAKTTNEQGNDNVARSDVDQKNDVDQSQSSTQKQDATQTGGPCCDSHRGDDKKDGKSECCAGGQSQTGEQKASFGDQNVGEQKNDADVSQKQGNGNVNVSPAIAIFGDAETTNKQGNDNWAKSEVDQRNDVDQSQDSYQRQSLEQSGSKGCCGHGRSQTGEQRVFGGEQSVDKQANDADVNQWQGNGNGSFAPAVALGGDATTRNYQGNHNTAESDVDQKNDVDQSQSSTQKQSATYEGGCCKPQYDCSSECQPKNEHGHEPSSDCARGCQPKKVDHEQCCEPGRTGEQKASFGDQRVGEQKNDADVSQKQGNWNGSVAPAIAFGGNHGSCSSQCGKSGYPHGGGAETTNKQGNGNYASSDLDQRNTVDQSQTAYQHQTLVDKCKGLIQR